jgi:quinoprotein glucose dehydrogenase
VQDDPVTPALRYLSVAALLLACSCQAPRSAKETTDLRTEEGAVEWAAHGRDAGGQRYAPLDQITPENVAQLEVAWTFNTGEDLTSDRGRDPMLETTPLMVDGTLFISTPRGRVIALDPETGTERWRFDPRVDPSLGFGDFASRGVSTWVDSAVAIGDPCRRRIYMATIDARLFALDAATGATCDGFGADGAIDLRQGLRNPPDFREEYEMTSPPAIIDDVVVTGSAVADNTRIDMASGEVRGWDARTGALRWSWDPVPQSPDDEAYDDWRGPNARRTGAANAWSVIVADPARDLVFVPTSSPSPDYYGGERIGSNRYADAVVALRGSTGELVWYFQTVHHDLWDYDNAAPPALTTIRRNGAEIPVVLQATKTGMLFVLHRETGEPVFPVEERPVPASTVPGEQAWPTQPFTTGIAPLSPHTLPLDSIWGPTPEALAECKAMAAPLRNEGVFTPPSLEGSLLIPSNIGGAQWGGVAIDPTRQVAIIPVNRTAAIAQLIPRDQVDRDEAERETSRLGYEYATMRGTPYVMRRRLFMTEGQMFCSPPPFGTLVAVDLTTGAHKWTVPLGSIQALAPDAPAEWGSPNLGGAIITSSGLIFIGATLDKALRAYDIETGRELWKGALPASARATPMTYRVRENGRQFVVVAAGGADVFGHGDAIVAFALPN